MKRYDIEIDFDECDRYIGYRKNADSQGYWIKSEDFDRYKQLIRQGYERMKAENADLKRQLENQKMKTIEAQNAKAY